MSTYRITGARYLRRYTADRTSPVYASSIDVQKIVNTLCTVPWDRVSAMNARMTYHTEENVGTKEDPISGLDKNVAIRDEFDAALFCAGHSGGQHRAYANAAVYRYELPDAAVGTTMESISLLVTSDPYNSNGARIHVMTNSTGEIPMGCHECRGEDSSGNVIDNGTTASRVAVRTTRTSDGDDYWYPTIESCTIAPNGGLQLQKYLFVFVLMESYATVRGNWIEGCSYIENIADLTTSTTVAGWTDGETYDLSVGSESIVPIVRDGVLPDIEGDHSGVMSIHVLSDGTSPTTGPDGNVSDIAQINDSLTPENITSGISSLYGRFLSGELRQVKLDVASPDRRRIGVGFCVRQASDMLYVAEDGRSARPKTLSITASSLVIPFSVPSGARAIRLDWRSWLEVNTPDPDAMINVWIKRGSFVTDYPDVTLKNPSVYTADSKHVDGWDLITTLRAESGTADISCDFRSALVASILLTAYVPQSAIRDTSSDFSKGIGQISDDPITPDSATPYDFTGMNVYTPGKSYSVGDIVVTPEMGLQDTSQTTGTWHVFGSHLRYLAISPDGDVLTSRYGANWTASESTVGRDVNSILIYYRDNNAQVLIGTADGIWKSSNHGITWTRCNGTAGKTLKNVRLEDGNLTAVGDDYVQEHEVYKSSDGGENWTKSVEIKNYTENIVFKVFCEQGQSMFFTWDDFGDRTIKWSSDGNTWTHGSGVHGPFRKPIYVRKETNNYYSSLTLKNGFFVVPTDDGIYWSDDGKTWNASNVRSGVFSTIRDMSPEQNIFCITNKIAISVCESDGGIPYATEDGKTWYSISGLKVLPFQDNDVSRVGSGIVNSRTLFGTNGNGIKIYDPPGSLAVFIDQVESAPDVIDFSKCLTRAMEFDDNLSALPLLKKAQRIRRFSGGESLIVPDVTLIA